MHKTSYAISASIVVGAFLGIAAVAFAAGDTTHAGHRPFARPVSGTVSAVNDATLTLAVTSSSTAAVTTYTVDDSSARILKSGATTTPSAVAVNDKIAVDRHLVGRRDSRKIDH